MTNIYDWNHPCYLTLSLVSDYFSPAGRRRLVAMMASPYRAYIDDSGKGHGPVFVLAGFVATVDQWAKFWREWEEVLKIPPAIEYFKMKEAAACQGQFLGWQETKRNERLRQFIEVIDRNVTAGIGSSIDQEAYRRVFTGKIAKGVDTPYQMNFYGVMQTLMRLQQAAGDSSPVDFIFDEQGREIGRALIGWKYFVRFAPPGANSLIGQPPISGNEKKVIPLQAADLLAWRIRRMLTDAFSGDQTAIHLLPFPKTLQVLVDTWDEPRLRHQLERIKDLRDKTGRVFPYDLSRKERRFYEKQAAKRRAAGLDD